MRVQKKKIEMLFHQFIKDILYNPVTAKASTIKQNDSNRQYYVKIESLHSSRVP